MAAVHTIGLCRGCRLYPTPRLLVGDSRGSVDTAIERNTPLISDITFSLDTKTYIVTFECAINHSSFIHWCISSIGQLHSGYIIQCRIKFRLYRKQLNYSFLKSEWGI